MLNDRKIRTLKLADYWIGAPVCWLLALFNRLINPFYKTVLQIPSGYRPKTILISKYFGMGSIVLASPLLKSLRSKYSDAKLVFLTFKNHANILNRIDETIEVISIDQDNPFALLYSIISALIFLRRFRPDISIDLEFYSNFSTLMAYLSGAKWRVGFYLPRFWRVSLINLPVYFNYERHILEIYGMIGKVSGVEVKDTIPAFIKVSGKELNHVERLFQENSLSSNNIVLGININASDLAYCRRWPKEKFAEVINAALAEFDTLRVILTGSQSENKYTSSIFPLINGGVKNKIIDLSGRLNLGQFIALLSRLELLLTNDSGPLHLAKAQGTPTISIWGPGSPDFYGPYGREKDRNQVIYKRWPCSPCLYIYRTDAGYFCAKKAPCLDQINSSEVVLAVKDALIKIGRGDK